MITTNDLYNWMDEFEEDPIVDGILITVEHQHEFVKSLNKKILGNIKNFDYLSIGGGQWSDKQESYLVHAFVKFLNSKNYPNAYLEEVDNNERGSCDGYDVNDQPTAAESLQLLRDRLTAALELEDYRRAAQLRDEINSLS